MVPHVWNWSNYSSFILYCIHSRRIYPPWFWHLAACYPISRCLGCTNSNIDLQPYFYLKLIFSAPCWAWEHALVCICLRPTSILLRLHTLFEMYSLIKVDCLWALYHDKRDAYCPLLPSKQLSAIMAPPSWKPASLCLWLS